MKNHDNRDIHRLNWTIFVVQLKLFVTLFQLLYIASKFAN